MVWASHKSSDRHRPVSLPVLLLPIPFMVMFQPYLFQNVHIKIQTLPIKPQIVKLKSPGLNYCKVLKLYIGPYPNP
jgi:hypothetical protein